MEKGRRGGGCTLFRKERKFRVPQSAYKYSINFSRLHNGMAVRLCIQCLEFEMKLLWEVEVEVERGVVVLK